MNIAFNQDLDLRLTRIIKGPRSAVWAAWADPKIFEQWWIPEPARCKVVEMELHPGGALLTEISEPGQPFAPHMNGCFLAVDAGARIVFTTALTRGWRPAADPFITAIIAFLDHPSGTEYAVHVMHKSPEDRTMHHELGFQDGWGTVAGQLARLVERQT